MTLAHSLDAVDAIITDAGKLRTGLPELHRRARIPSRRDGYPNRASGAQPGTITTPRDSYTLSTVNVTAFNQTPQWLWVCSCSVQALTTHPTSFEALSDGQAHYDDQHGSQAVSYSDSCGEAAIAPYRPDPVAKQYQRVERIINQAERLLASAVAIANHIPTDTEDNTAWCAACSTIKHPEDGRPYLTPPDSRIKGATTVNGRLKEPMTLCSWHYDYIRNEGNLPPRAITAEYVTKGRAPRKSA